MSRLLFLGNDGALLKKLLRIEGIKLIGVVGNRVSSAERAYFGSSVVIARRLHLPVVRQEDFNAGYRRYLAGQWKEADIIFIHGYRHKIKKDIIKNKKIKLVNFHQSLLPAYAGRHPLNWAIIRGEKYTGITFHYVNEKIDAGDIVLQKRIKICTHDTIISLYNKTIKCAAQNIEEVLSRLCDISFVPAQQDAKRRSYFPHRTPEEGRITKNDTLLDIRNKIRALVFPYPGAFVEIDGKSIVVEGVCRVKNKKRTVKIDFVGIHKKNIYLRLKDCLLKITKIRGSRGKPAKFSNERYR